MRNDESAGDEGSINRLGPRLTADCRLAIGVPQFHECSIVNSRRSGVSLASSALILGLAQAQDY